MKENTDFFQATNATPSFHISDEAEACAAVLMACLRANELNGDVYNAAFLTTIRSRNIFIGYDPDALINKASEQYELAGSPAALIDVAIGAIREQTRLPLFYHCADVILSDGLVTPKEHKVFQYLKSRFRVDDELASKALEVLIVKGQL